MCTDSINVNVCFLEAKDSLGLERAICFRFFAHRKSTYGF